MKNLSLVFIASIVLTSCSPNLSEKDMKESKRIIGTWVIDVEATTPYRIKLFKSYGWSEKEIKKKLEELSKLDATTKMIITNNTLSVSERGKVRQINYTYLGNRKMRSKINNKTFDLCVEFKAQDRIQLDDGGVLSDTIWKKSK